MLNIVGFGALSIANPKNLRTERYNSLFLDDYENYAVVTLCLKRRKTY